MHSLSIIKDSEFQSMNKRKDVIINDDIQKAVGLNSLKESFYDTFGLMKSDRARGAVNPQIKGVIDPSDPRIKYGYSFRNKRERLYSISFPVLREISRKTGIIRSIQNTRTMQIKPFAQTAYNDDDIGFRVKLKDRNRAPSPQEEKQMDEVEQFFLHTGKKDFDGAEEREDRLVEVMTKLTLEMMTIDQVAISLRYNNRGDLLDFWILDGATIKRISMEGYKGDKSIKFVQEINGKVLETFTSKDLIFYCNNPVVELNNAGFGYSYIEMCIDLITGWLFAMGYNKEFFNTSAMPKGFLSFEGSNLDQTALEELQREWIAMFRGVRGLWRTPFLQYNAKWNNMSPNNRDMEWNQYVQVLSSWICAIHGIDSAEMGLRLAQAQNVLNENNSAKIAYSKDRGLKELISFMETVFNKIIDRVPEWDGYEIQLTGFEAKEQSDILEIDKGQTEAYMTLNEKRKEKDLPPVEGGDVVLNPSFIQMKTQQSMMGGQSSGGQPGVEEQINELDENQKKALTSASDNEINSAIEETMGKSKSILKKSKKIFNDRQDYIEVEL